MTPLNPLGRKVETEPKCELHRSFSIWTDLLGFGRPFSDAMWSPNPEVWTAQTKRVGNAYRRQCENIQASLEGDSYMLLLNDGMVRTLTWRAKSSATLLGLWVRAGIDAHVSVVRDELADSLPGARTVISSGWTAAHSFSEVQFDDLVLDFTRARPGMSKLAEMTGNPVVVSNPAPLQLNTAFSRAYLLDAAGSKHGISGARVYLDSQFIDDISSEFQGRKGFRVNNWERSNDRIFALERLSRSIRKTTPRQIPTLAEWAARQPAVEAGIIRVMQEFPSRRQPWVFGFLLERDHITVNLPNLQTTVYRVLAFFPHDEDPSDFMVDL